MNGAFFVQLFNYAVLFLGIIIYTPATLRFFMSRARLFDPLKVSKWLFYICAACNIALRTKSGATTLFDYHGDAPWPIASFLMYVSLATAMAALFLTERAVDAARKP